MTTGVRATSTELTGGAGFTYEDTVVAYYLTALLREDRAAGQSGVVTSVAVQQSGNGYPMDDLVVEFEDNQTGDYWRCKSSAHYALLRTMRTFVRLWPRPMRRGMPLFLVNLTSTASRPNELR